MDTPSGCDDDRSEPRSGDGGRPAFDSTRWLERVVAIRTTRRRRSSWSVITVFRLGRITAGSTLGPTFRRIHELKEEHVKNVEKADPSDEKKPTER